MWFQPLKGIVCPRGWKVINNLNGVGNERGTPGPHIEA